MNTRTKTSFFILTATIFMSNGCRTTPYDESEFSQESVSKNSLFPLEDVLSDESLNNSTDEEFSSIVLPDERDKATAPYPQEIWDLSDVDVSTIDCNRKLIAFTFDDAPTRYLENIFAVFAAFNEENPDCKASATYFFNGKLFDNENVQLLHSAVAMGFELGNHTYSHFDLTTLSDEELR